MFGATRNTHPVHHEQNIGRITTSVVLHVIAAVVLFALIVALLVK
jgi:hypothetical protein